MGPCWLLGSWFIIPYLEVKEDYHIELLSSHNNPEAA